MFQDMRREDTRGEENTRKAQSDSGAQDENSGGEVAEWEVKITQSRYNSFWLCCGIERIRWKELER